MINIKPSNFNLLPFKTEKLKIYIAGPISDRLDTYKKHFDRAEQLLTAQGHIVWNPAHSPIGLNYDDYFPVCFAMIDTCDAIYLLSGWSKSEGCRREINYAYEKGKKIYVERVC